MRKQSRYTNVCDSLKMGGVLYAGWCIMNSELFTPTSSTTTYKKEIVYEQENGI